MSTFVLKYGGTSVGSTEKIKLIAQKLVDRKEKGDDLVVVVSAMGGTTDDLVNLAKAVSPDPNQREMDMLLSTGEQVSIALLSMAIRDLGYEAVSLTGLQAGIETCSTHTKARISKVNNEKIQQHLNDGKIVVVAGFQGVSENGDITTLGRGGSDTTAVSLAASLGCDCEIYTDVDGIYTVDPKLYPRARKLDFIAYEEMLEMASRGAKVLETRSVEMASKFKVPVYVAHSLKDYKGTYIKEMTNTMEKKVVTGITVEEDCIMVSLNMIPYDPQNISKIFNEIASQNIMIDMISQTAPYDSFVSVSFSSYEGEKHKIKKIIENFKMEFPTIDYSIDPSIIKLSVVGIGMVSQAGVAADLFNILASNDIEFYQVTTSEISISYTISEKDKEKAVLLIAEKFDL